MSEAVTTRRRKRSGFGIASFALSVLALLFVQAWIGILAFYITLFLGGIVTIDGVDDVAEVGAQYLVFPWFVGVMGTAVILWWSGVAVYVAAYVVGGLSVVFAVVALIRRSERVFPVTGLVISGIILAINLLVYIGFLSKF